jgi:hypothetical protein
MNASHGGDREVRPLYSLGHRHERDLPPGVDASK